MQLARRIATFTGLDQIAFRVADLDEMTAAELYPPFDVVLCLAVEAHVQKPQQLYELLGEVTRGHLFFEANGSTPPKSVEAEWQRVGFEEIRHLGTCDDDIVPRNNRRPIFTALRTSA